MTMTQDQVLGLIRHTLTFVGGILIAKGLISEGASQEIIGAAMTLAGSIWSWVKNKGVA
jgi:hypothetical protein